MVNNGRFNHLVSSRRPQQQRQQQRRRQQQCLFCCLRNGCMARSMEGRSSPACLVRECGLEGRLELGSRPARDAIPAAAAAAAAAVVRQAPQWSPVRRRGQAGGQAGGRAGRQSPEPHPPLLGRPPVVVVDGVEHVVLHCTGGGQFRSDPACLVSRWGQSRRQQRQRRRGSSRPSAGSGASRPHHASRRRRRACPGRPRGRSHLGQRGRGTQEGMRAEKSMTR